MVILKSNIHTSLSSLILLASFIVCLVSCLKGYLHFQPSPDPSMGKVQATSAEQGIVHPV